jgi:hypothetical protein
VTAIAATWLDAQSEDSNPGIAQVGFGAEVRDALARRSEFLLQSGHADRDRDGFVRLTDAAREHLKSAELSREGRRLATQLSLTFRDVRQGEPIKGTYRQSIWLASGQFAMLEHNGSLSLVPWRSVLEGRIGQVLSVTARGDVVDWTVGRERSIGR